MAPARLVGRLPVNAYNQNRIFHRQSRFVQ